MNILICGASGSGKTQYVKEVEKLVGQPWIYKDLDELIAQKNNVNSNELGTLINKNGWEWFRAQEHENLISILAENKNLILSLGGGTLTQNIYNEFKDSVKLYWLDTDVELCWERVSSDSNRPLVQLGRDHFLEQFKEREKLYSMGQILPQIQDFIRTLEI